MASSFVLLIAHLKFSLPFSVADPGFPRGGGANPKGGRQPIIWPIFPENCMKMKKFGAGGGARPSRPPLKR